MRINYVDTIGVLISISYSNHNLDASVSNNDFGDTVWATI